MLRPYQQKAHDDAVHHLRNTDKNGVVVMATGGGKSHNIAALAEHNRNNGGDTIILAHRKELLEQNAGKFQNFMDVGIYSAGLRVRELDKPIIVAGIQSIYNKELTRKPRLIIADECHLLANDQNGDSMYWQFLRRYPEARIMGYTATPYRTNEGKLLWGDVCHVTGYNDLFPEYLAPLTYKLPKAHIDTSNIKVRMGDFVASELEAESIKYVEATIKALLQYGQERESWMVFASGVEHAKALRWALSANNIYNDLVTGETPDGERAKIIDDFKNKRIRAVVNCDVLTTGFDAPNVDLICIARPTMSPGLHEQILGRGTRQARGKENCLVIDLAWNTIEHGKLGEIDWQNMAGTIKPKKDYKACPNCESLVKVVDKECGNCGYVFPTEEREKKVEHKLAPVTEDDFKPQFNEYDVISRNFEFALSKKGAIPMMKVVYECQQPHGYGYVKFYDYVCLAHGGYAEKKAWQWMAENLHDTSKAEMLRSFQDGKQRIAGAIKQEYRHVTKIRVKEQPKKFPEIVRRWHSKLVEVADTPKQSEEPLDILTDDDFEL